MHLPRLSVCVIARNEAANILRCLDSVCAVAAERIVVDTGSTDATVALAEQAGATVTPFAWRDDFSAARNAALERATGDWILWLDADEWLLPESAAGLPALLSDPRVQAYELLRQEMEYEGQTEGFIEARMCRLWRNDPALRFVGRCHPHFGTLLDERARRTGQQLQLCEVRLRHSGYLAHLMPAKLARAARLLQWELTDRPGQLYYEIELARTWMRLGEARGARLMAHCLNRILAEGDALMPPTTLAAPVLEWFLRNADLSDARWKPTVLLADRWFPDCPPLLDAAATRLHLAGRFAEALPFWKRLARCAVTARYNRAVAFHSAALGDAPLLHLAVCYHRLARLDQAEHWYERLLARSPGQAEATQNLALLRAQRRQFR